MAVVRTDDPAVHVMPWDDDAGVPVYGHRPSPDCLCRPMELRQQNLLNERYMVYFHDASYRVEVEIHVL